MSNKSLNLKNLCLAIAAGLVLASPAAAQRGGRSAPPSMPPAQGTAAGDLVQDRTRERLDTPDRDRLRDREPLYLGMRDRLQRFDRDRDGFIDRSEFRQWHESAYDAINAGGNDGFTLQEFQAVRLGSGPRSDVPGARSQRNQDRAQLRKAERFRLMDGNGDGIVTRAEYMNFGELNYLDADANDDGKLSYTELQQFHRGW